jgi:hypothetical protein
MELCNTVDLMRTDDSQIRHANHLGLRFFNDGNTGKNIPILGELALDTLQEIQVDLVDDLEVSWKQVLEQWNRPLLKCFWENGVIGVSELERVSSV